MYFDVNSEIFSPQKGNNYQSTGRKNVESLSLHRLTPPHQHVSDSDRDWMAEFLSGGSEGATLGCRSKPCSLVNFNNKVYIFMSICLTTVLFLK